MRIEELIIDGFKSYAKRTRITGFDISFNAITGLNGSGKSNILDALCFVLGITNLSLVRASKLQDLVYKQGKAGITKASVSIVFNNEDKHQSPLGYEHFDKITVTRQVVIGGKNKYLINSHNAQASRVQTLFHSVGLNINNPHFLIMQGRITKVLNMKPPEILGMIAEAAGTRMFEMKKHEALKTIDKKDRKLEEITRVLDEEIGPKMRKLEQERSDYMAYVKNVKELEELDRFVTAWNYQANLKMLASSNEEEREMKEREKELERSNATALAQAEQLGAEISSMAKERAKQMKAEFPELERARDEQSKVLVKAQTISEHKESLLHAEMAKHDECTAIQDKLVGKRDALAERLAQERDQLQAATDTHARLSKEHQAYRLAYQANDASLALNAEEGGKSLEEQLQDAQGEAIEAETEMKASRMRIVDAKSQLKERRARLKPTKKQYDAALAQAEEAEGELAAAQEQYERMSSSFDAGREKALQKQIQRARRDVQKQRAQLDKVSAKLGGLRFDYQSPHSSFDHSKVKGLVANLISLKDPDTATALSVAAGGKLYHVVVDDEKTAQALLKGGKLRRRVTIIPLTKIKSGREITPDIIQAAKDAAQESSDVTLALQLVGYDSEVHKAMKFVFGSTFITKDAATSTKVTFNKAVRTRSVTLDGDVYEPQGVLSGGSRGKEGSPLVLLQRVNDMKRALEEQQKALKALGEELEAQRALEAQMLEENASVETLAHQARLMRQAVEESEHHVVKAQVDELEQTIVTETERAREMEERQGAAQDKIAKVKQQMKERKGRGGSSTASDMEEVSRKMAETKEALGHATATLKNLEQSVLELELELEQHDEELQGVREQMTEAKETLSSLETECKRARAKVDTEQKRYQSALAALEARQVELSSNDARIAELQAKKDALDQQAVQGEVEIKNITAKLRRHVEERAGAKAYVKGMEKKHAWIRSEREYFGRPGTEFDFGARDPSQAQHRLDQLRKEQEGLKHTLNGKVMDMYEQVGEEFSELDKKKNILYRDKQKLIKVIDELDAKKNIALEKTWQKVTRDFGSIFSTLLKDTTALLQPPDGGTILDGLEVKVAFNGVFKELTELSGGQRSLLALSLILSLLLFKPAPLYILDEIDAALDLSHTENIGHMLKTHFSQSQFVIVSLKEGMWKNANVLFRTNFVDGSSTVTRTTPNKMAGPTKLAQSTKTKPRRRGGAKHASVVAH